MQEVENIIRIFNEAKVAIEKKDSFNLKSLSNQTINTASRTQDPDNVAVAVIVYSLSKVLERYGIGDEKEYSQIKNVTIEKIEELIISLKKNNEPKIKKDLENLRKAIAKSVKGMSKNIEEVFRKASINKASRIYDHGISMEKTAKLLGISVWEVANYAGSQGNETKFKGALRAKDRIKIVEDIFK